MDLKRFGYFKMLVNFGKLDDEFEENVVGGMEEDELEEFSDDDDEEFFGRVELDEFDFIFDEDEEDMDMDIWLKNVIEWNEIGGNKLVGKDVWVEILGGKNWWKKDGV